MSPEMSAMLRDKSNGRFPYTYAADYLRMAASDLHDPSVGARMSRSEASMVRQAISRATGIPDENLAIILAAQYMQDIEPA